MEEEQQEARGLTYTTIAGQAEDWRSSSHQPMHPSEPLDNTIYQEDFSYHHQQQLPLQQQQLQQPQQQQTRSKAIAIIRAPDNKNEHETDDDDSVLDVERDAIELEQKYGGKIVQTFQDKTLLPSKLLKAPYLGSLNLSENFLSLPPMSLSDQYDGDPPHEIGSYGSLRDSHEMGRFLDGPSSYREPRSGQIRKLDHRVRYHGQSLQMSIGERMQRARNLKESRRKDEKSNGEKKSESKGSLSAVMNGMGQKPVSDGADSIQQPSLQNAMQPIGNVLTRELPTAGIVSNDDVNDMMSTSLTAFEVLKHSSRMLTSNSNSEGNGTTQRPLDSGDVIADDSHFQPLSHSMSDPTPDNQSLSRRLNNSLLSQQMPPSAMGNVWAPSTVNGMPSVNNMTMNSDEVEANRHPVGYSLGSVPNSFEYPTVDHNPDIDGAFDMDME